MNVDMESITIQAGITIPKLQRAVVVEAGDTIRIRDDIPIPSLRPDQCLVRTDAIALNPADLKMRGAFVNAGAVLGYDYAGTVIARGPAVTSIELGDRICGAQHCMNLHRPDCGAFAEYNLPAGRVWMKLPAAVDTEAGATFGAAISTAGLALKLLGLPLPDAPALKPARVLVNGGSTATATVVIQLLKLANMIPIATCSPANSERVRSLGAEATFDYREADCASKIRSYTKNNLRYALDCITTVDSTALCIAAIGRAGGKYVSLEHPSAQQAATRAVVKTDWVLGPSIFGEGLTWPEPYARPPSKEDQEYGERLWAMAQRLVDEGRLRHHPVRVLEGGLERVIEGMEMVRKGELRGEKCVVKLTE